MRGAIESWNLPPGGVEHARVAGGAAHGVTVREGSTGRGLFAMRDVAPGELVLEVPLSACIGPRCGAAHVAQQLTFLYRFHRLTFCIGSAIAERSGMRFGVFRSGSGIDL